MGILESKEICIFLFHNVTILKHIKYVYSYVCAYNSAYTKLYV